MSLLDQFGAPIKKADLLREQSAPSVMGTRQVMSNHPSRGLTPERLARILLEAEEGDSTRYFELAEDMEEKDLHLLGVLGTRKRAVAQMEITVEAASDDSVDQQIAADFREFLRRDTLQQEIFDILDAIGKGMSCSEILWDTSSGEKWVPRAIVRRDPRFFEFSREDGETLLLRDGGQLVPLKPMSYIVHFAKAKSGIPIRGGLARCVSWVWLFKNFSLKDWVSFGEVFGQPYRVGKYQPNATKEDKTALLRAVASIGSDAAAIIPEGMLIEFIEAAKSGSVDVYDRMTRFLDEQLSKAVLGQTTTTEVTQGGGSRALGDVHASVAKDIRDSDAVSLAATLNRDLVRPYVIFNFGPRAKYPRLLIGRADELELKERLNQTAKFVALGMRVGVNEVRSRLGWSEPKGEDEVLRAIARVAGPSPALPSDTAFQSLPPAKETRRALHSSTMAPADRDAIDDAVHDALSGDTWVPVINQVIDPVRALLDRAATLNEVRAGIAAMLDDNEPGQLADRIARALFGARLAGETDVPREGDGA